MSLQETGTDADIPANPALAVEARIARVAVTVFPILVVVAGLAGFLLPGAFKPLAPGVPYLLGIIMFCMGLTLTPPDFASVARRPWAVVLGIVAHYVIMPSAGWLIAVGLHLEPELAVGLILVGCARPARPPTSWRSWPRATLPSPWPSPPYPPLSPPS